VAIIVRSGRTMGGVTVVNERHREEETGAARGSRWWLAPAVWWRELLIISIGYGLYTLIQHHLNVSPFPALRNATDIFSFERHLGIAVERPLNHDLVAHPALASTANFYYVVMHEVVTPAVIFWVFRWRRAAYPQARFLLAVPTLIGFTLYYVVPVAPPRLLPATGMIDTMAHFVSPGSYSAGPISYTAAQFAAFPSLHFAWALWCAAMVCWLVRRWYVRVVAACYPFCTALVVLATANHYVVDLVGGLTVSALGVALLLLLQPAESSFSVPGAASRGFGACEGQATRDTVQPASADTAG
jgi:PAP2 superfamily